MSQPSFKSFKETLKQCTNLLSSAASSDPRTQELERHAGIPRKPPKTSLRQQLHRLGESSPSLRPLPCCLKPELTGKKDSGEEDDALEENEIEKIEFEGLERSKLGQFQFDHSGPFEPLILSPPGEVPLVQVPASINCRLLEHQREGVRFLYKLYEDDHGGILGDDMGLGKTIQTIAFLSAVFGQGVDMGDSDAVVGDREMRRKRAAALVICPTSVVHNWEAEFSRWAGGLRVSLFHGPNRDLILEKLEARGVEVLITSFDSYRIHGGSLSDLPWEIVIVDEAHRLKNEKSKLYGTCLETKTRKRIGLTGTVMQNKIMELFNLFDWAAPGSLGTREQFRKFYDEPIRHGQRSTAPAASVLLADERREQLASVLRRYMLRRTKEETIGHLMMGKEDNVVFCGMSELQKRAYRRMLQLPEIRCLVNKDLPCECGSMVKQVECCRRIVPDGVIWPFLHEDQPEGCDSCPFCLVLPLLIKLQQISNHLELIKPNPKDEPEKQRKDAEFASAVFGPDLALVGGIAQKEDFLSLSETKDCGKMRVLQKLVSTWTSHGDKILLFSYSVRMLDILEKWLVRRGHDFSRLDGATPMKLRQPVVDEFNSSPSKQVFLISTRAGGLGLNLVSANRVVIFDPNWNPAQDSQAQDRSFRFGQKRHVVVYRLLAAGSFEELIYTRQVYKQQLSNIVVSGKMEKRYFEGVQDCKQFQGELFGICNLFRDLSDTHFTSDIIHGKHEEDASDRSAAIARHEAAGLSIRSSKPILEGFGVVHAHRNEDVVNFRGYSKNTNDESMSDCGKDEEDAPSARQQEEMNRQDHNFSSTNEIIRIQFGFLANFMDMEREPL